MSFCFWNAFRRCSMNTRGRVTTSWFQTSRHSQRKRFRLYWNPSCTRSTRGTSRVVVDSGGVQGAPSMLASTVDLIRCAICCSVSSISCFSAPNYNKSVPLGCVDQLVLPAYSTSFSQHVFVSNNSRRWTPDTGQCTNVFWWMWWSCKKKKKTRIACSLKLMDKLPQIFRYAGTIVFCSVYKLWRLVRKAFRAFRLNEPFDRRCYLDSGFLCKARSPAVEVTWNIATLLFHEMFPSSCLVLPRSQGSRKFWNKLQTVSGEEDT